MEQPQQLLEKWDVRARGLRSRMEIFGEGLMLGAGTVLAGIAQDERGRPRLALRDGPRVMALLATAYERPVEPYVLAKLRRACERWTEGDKGARPYIHLAMPACRRQAILAAATLRARGETLERLPIRWNHLIEKESLKFKELEHAGIEKADQLF